MKKENNLSFPKSVIGNPSLINKKVAEVPDKNTRVRQYCSAFTLIELLVVVLIIGILSAIALPQYQKAVKKARATQAIIIARALANAEEAYYLTNNEYTTVSDNLDISVTLPTDWNFNLEESLLYVSSDKFMPNSTITYFYLHGDTLPGKLVCWANNNDTAAQKLCKTVGGTQIADSGGGKNWLIGA